MFWNNVRESTNHDLHCYNTTVEDTLLDRSGAEFSDGIPNSLQLTQAISHWPDLKYFSIC